MGFFTAAAAFMAACLFPAFAALAAGCIADGNSPGAMVWAALAAITLPR